jgi:hypothetical protein
VKTWVQSLLSNRATCAATDGHDEYNKSIHGGGTDAKGDGGFQGGALSEQWHADVAECDWMKKASTSGAGGRGRSNGKDASRRRLADLNESDEEGSSSEEDEYESGTEEEEEDAEEEEGEGEGSEGGGRGEEMLSADEGGVHEGGTQDRRQSGLDDSPSPAGSWADAAEFPGGEDTASELDSPGSGADLGGGGGGGVGGGGRASPLGDALRTGGVSHAVTE